MQTFLYILFVRFSIYFFFSDFDKFCMFVSHKLFPYLSMMSLLLTFVLIYCSVILNKQQLFHIESLDNQLILDNIK